MATALIVPRAARVRTGSAFSAESFHDFPRGEKYNTHRCPLPGRATAHPLPIQLPSATRGRSAGSQSLGLFRAAPSLGLITCIYLVAARDRGLRGDYWMGAQLPSWTQVIQNT
jgi:hypothetical protein